jgi:Ras-related protein Rab-5C
MDREKFLEAKIIILGASNVGKTSIAIRFCRGTFPRGQDATIGITHLQQVVKLKGHSIKFLIYDTAGQERFESLAASYFRAADAAILVYDLTRKETIGKARKWHQELKQNTTKPVLLAVVGNKADLIPTSQRCAEEAEHFAEEIGALHMCVSASADENISALFTWVAERLNPSLLLEPDPTALQNRGLSVRDVHVPEPSQSSCLSC